MQEKQLKSKTHAHVVILNFCKNIFEQSYLKFKIFENIRRQTAKLLVKDNFQIKGMETNSSSKKRL